MLYKIRPTHTHTHITKNNEKCFSLRKLFSHTHIHDMIYTHNHNENFCFFNFPPSASLISSFFILLHIYVILTWLSCMYDNNNNDKTSQSSLFFTVRTHYISFEYVKSVRFFFFIIVKNYICVCVLDFYFSSKYDQNTWIYL